MKKNKKNKPRAYFLQRVVSYLIDMMIISLVASLVTFPFTNNKTVEKLSEEANTVVQNYVDQKIDASTYLNQSIDISYEQAKLTGLSTIITIIILVLYFIVFQVYRGGQTIGKKLMKIKIIKKDESDLTMNNMILRGLFNNFILADILIAIITLFGKNAYFYGTSVVQMIQYVFIIITIFMIIIRKDGRGLPDLIAGTKVINLNEEVEEEEVCVN